MLMTIFVSLLFVTLFIWLGARKYKKDGNKASKTMYAFFGLALLFVIGAFNPELYKEKPVVEKPKVEVKEAVKVEKVEKQEPEEKEEVDEEVREVVDCNDCGEYIDYMSEEWNEEEKKCNDCVEKEEKKEEVKVEKPEKSEEEKPKKEKVKEEPKKKEVEEVEEEISSHSISALNELEEAFNSIVLDAGGLIINIESSDDYETTYVTLNDLFREADKDVQQLLIDEWGNLVENNIRARLFGTGIKDFKFVYFVYGDGSNVAKTNHFDRKWKVK